MRQRVRLTLRSPPQESTVSCSPALPPPPVALFLLTLSFRCDSLRMLAFLSEKPCPCQSRSHRASREGSDDPAPADGRGRSRERLARDGPPRSLARPPRRPGRGARPSPEARLATTARRRLRTHAARDLPTASDLDGDGGQRSAGGGGGAAARGREAGAGA